MGEIDRWYIGKGEGVKDKAQRKKGDRKRNNMDLSNGFKKRKSEGQSKNYGGKKSETSRSEELQAIRGQEEVEGDWMYA